MAVMAISSDGSELSHSRTEPCSQVMSGVFFKAFCHHDWCWSISMLF
jgi:hypothetical protein